MKILFVVDTYPPHVNGASIATHRIVQGLSRAGHEIAVVAPSTTMKNSFEKDGQVPIYRVRSVAVLNQQQLRVSPQVLVYQKSLKEIIKRFQPDVININNPTFMGPSTIFVNRSLHIPMVGTVHLMPENLLHHLYVPDRIEDIVSNMIWKQYAQLFNKLDAVISPTSIAAQLLKKNGLKTKTYVISNGIDLERFKKDEESGEELKKKYNIPDVPTALFVGRLDKEKQLDFFIRAAAKVKEKADFHIVIAGKGKEHEDLMELSKEEGLEDRVTFTGYLPESELAKIYNVADFFVMPGIAELQSLVTMEAMATGKPILAANAIALPYLVKNKRNGFLYNPKDNDDMSEKFLQLVTNKELRIKMGRESDKLIQAHDFNTVIKETVAIYQSVMKERKRKNALREYNGSVHQKNVIRKNVARVRNIASRIVS